MKIVKPILSVGLISAMLVGCGANDNNDRFANNNNDNRPMGVRYNPNDNFDGTRYNNNRLGMNDNRDGFGTNVNTNNGNRLGTNDNSNNRNRVDVADEVADKVTELKEVQDANVFVTNRNAYVAVRLSGGNANNVLTDNVERKITDKVREADKDIDNVYISENADFYDRMNGYRNDLRNGNQNNGFFERFTETIQDVFPNRR